MSITVSGFQRGSCVVMPARVSGGRAEYFIPSLLANLYISQDGATDEAALPSAPALHVPGSWMLSESRRHPCEEMFDAEAAEATRCAIACLDRTPLTYASMVAAAAFLLQKPASRLLRDAIAWVNGASPGSARLIPPPSSALEGLLRDLAAFAGRADIPLWIRQAISYYQFVHIHPFADGNGRYSRALVVALGERDTAGHSRAFLVATALTLHRKTFIAYFDDVQNGSLARYLACWESLCRWSADYARRLALQEDAQRARLCELVGSDRLGRPLFALLAASPAVVTRSLADKFKWSAKTATIHIERLVSAGWLRPVGTKSDLNISPPIIDLRRNLLREIRAETRSLLVPDSSISLVAENNSQ